MEKSEAVRRLMEMDCDTVYAKDIAPIVRIHPQTLIDYAKTGRWDQETMGNFIISGDSVKFFRLDFLKKCGFIEPDPDEPKERDVILSVISALETLLEAQKQTIMLLEEQNEMLRRRMA